MEHYLPQIFWHDRTGLLSVDIQKRSKPGKYKIVTSSMQKEVRIWEFFFEANDQVAPLAVNFLANLSGHNTSINQVKFCPNLELNLLASGDSHGRITIWQLSDSPPPPPQDQLPPNKENWIRLKNLNHDEDVTSLCWSPDGNQIASVSNDNCLCVHDALTAKRVFTIRNFRQLPNGVCWDPKGKYIITMSADRKMDIVDAVKGTKLKHFFTAELPQLDLAIENGPDCLEGKTYKLFHDDQLYSFQRGVDFSPNGELVIAPCAHLETGSSDLFGSYVFKREDLAKDTPSAFYPCPKPTFLVKFSPITFELIDSTTNFLGLPYRLLWACLTRDGIYFYDSQHQHPIGVVDNIHYNAFTGASWSTDGTVLVVSSLEGYCSFVKFKLDAWGTVITEVVPRCESPQLIDEKKIRKKKSIANASNIDEEAVKSPHRKETTTSKSATPLTKFFKIDKSEKPVQQAEAPESPVTPKASGKVKKRVQLVTIED